jgi:hypothetical protein
VCKFVSNMRVHKKDPFSLLLDELSESAESAATCICPFFMCLHSLFPTMLVRAYGRPATLTTVTEAFIAESRHYVRTRSSELRTSASLADCYAASSQHPVR